jgi:prepilin-type N-terminal cleavage/methylation domain-containing protein
MKKLNNQSGFTLIELILVIAILGILAVAVAPSFTNLLTNASTTGGRGTAGAIQSGINTAYAERVASNTTPFWVATLSGNAGACSTTNPCFGNVVQPITSGNWTVTTAGTVFTYSNAGVSQTWTYTPATGTLTCTAGTC